MGKLRERRSAWEIILLRGKMRGKSAIPEEKCAGKWNLVEKQAFHGKKKFLEKFSLVI